MSDLRQQIGNLTPAEKADLIDELWVSLEADAPSLSDAQRPELDRRLATLEHDRADAVAWETVKADLARRCPSARLLHPSGAGSATGRAGVVRRAARRAWVRDSALAWMPLFGASPRTRCNSRLSIEKRSALVRRFPYALFTSSKTTA